MNLPTCGPFQVCHFVIQFDVRVVKIWWKHDSGSFEEDLKSFRDDRDACELFMFAFNKNCEVEIFTKPKQVT